MLSGNLFDTLVVAENTIEEVVSLDTSHEGGDDPNFNDSLFVEDDCDEINEEIDN